MNGGGVAEVAWSRLLRRVSAGQIVLWMVAALFMLAAHAAAGWWVLREKPPLIDSDAGPAFAVELVADMMAPEGPVEQITMDKTDSAPDEELETERTDPAEPERLTEEIAPEPPNAVTKADTTTLPAAAVDPLLPKEVEPALEPELSVSREKIAEPDAAELPAAMEIVPTPRPLPNRLARKESPEKQEIRPRVEAKAAPSRQQTRAQAKTAASTPSAPAAREESGSGSTAATARWQARLIKHLERRKRYPAEARRAKRQGEAQVRFTIDASGNVASVALARSSGVPELDAEAIAMVRRASPVPAPPPGAGHTIVVPIRFSLR